MAHLGKRAHSQKAIEGVSGLFDSQDEPMRMVYFSQLVEVQAVFANIPFVAIGVVALAFAVVLVVIGRLNRGLFNLLLGKPLCYQRQTRNRKLTGCRAAGALALGGAILSTANLMACEWSEEPNFVLTVAASTVLASSVGFTAWYLFRRAEQPGRAEGSTSLPTSQPQNNENPGGEPSTTTWSLNSQLHSGSWAKYGYVGLIFRALLYLVVATVVALEVAWRLAFSRDAEPFITVYFASAGFQLFFLAAVTLHSIVSCYSQRQSTPPLSNILYISPILFGNAIGLVVVIINLVMINFSETPLGRLLTAIRMFVYMTNAVMEALRSPGAAGIATNPIRQTILFDNSLKPQRQSTQNARPRSVTSPAPSSEGQISAPLDLTFPATRSSPSGEKSDADSSDWFATTEKKHRHSLDGRDSPIDRDVSQNSQVSRPSAIFTPTGSEPSRLIQGLYRAPIPSEPPSSIAGPASEADSQSTITASSTAPRRAIAPPVAPPSSLRRPTPLATIRQDSHESKEDESLYPATEEAHRSNSGPMESPSTASSSAHLSELGSSRFPLPPESTPNTPSAVSRDSLPAMMAHDKSLTIANLARRSFQMSAVVDQEEFIFEPPRADRFERSATPQRGSEMTLGSAGSLGESLPERSDMTSSSGDGTDGAAERNITSFIAPCVDIQRQEKKTGHQKGLPSYGSEILSAEPPPVPPKAAAVVRAPSSGGSARHSTDSSGSSAATDLLGATILRAHSITRSQTHQSQ